MFLNPVGYYVVSPTKKLLEALDNEPINPDSELQIWYKPQIWIVSEDRHVTGDREAAHLPYLKLLVMLDIIQTMNPPFPLSSSQFFKRLLGEPPYDINLLDQWWNFERAGNATESILTMEKTSADHLRQIKKTGDPAFDEWLEANIEARTQDS